MDISTMRKIHETDTVALDTEDNCLVIIDQTLLPNAFKLLRLQTVPEVYEAIKTLRVRGAPAIGAAAACAVYLSAVNREFRDFESFSASVKEDCEYLASARPTAVNLFYALERMQNRLRSCGFMQKQEITAALRDEALSVIEEDIKSCRAIGENGLPLLRPGMGILTHCNAGRLAAIRYGTATAPIYLGQERGYNFKVFADETRPLLQGARLTALELYAAGVDLTLICDNMAASVMKAGRVQAVITGCDRVARNGDSANKIGTLGLAVLAKNYGIPFYIAAPLSTVDLNTASGSDIVIEQRSGDEVTRMWYEKPTAPDGIQVFNPAFDVTDAGLITAIITDCGVVYPPFEQGLSDLKERPDGGA